MEPIVIVGGGLVGSLLAIMLAQAEYPVTVYEERDYQQQRRPNADTIADLCLDHSIELMARVKEPHFQLRKKIEHTVEMLAPDRPSLYYNISFTTMPYAQAVTLEQRHRRLIDQLLQVENIEAKLSDPNGRQWIKEVFLSPEHQS